MTNRRRDVSAAIRLEARGAAQLALQVAVAAEYDDVDEQLSIVQAGRELPSRELRDQHGTRIHVVDVEEGPIAVEYRATVRGDAPAAAVDPTDELRYLRPSRYCESDALGPTARTEFAALHGEELFASVTSWVGTRLAYVPGSSLPTDGAEQTLLARRGVCRDYAHLVVAFLRALDVPARVVGVYAPGLDPMDFHAVAEAAIDGSWRVVDATTLAPRQSLVRVATGRDAADTAFLSTRGAAVVLEDLRVSAVVDALPRDDVTRLVSLR